MGKADEASAASRDQSLWSRWLLIDVPRAVTPPFLFPLLEPFIRLAIGVGAGQPADDVPSAGDEHDRLLKLALEEGSIGTFSFEIGENTLRGDELFHRLLGADAGTLCGPVAAFLSHVYPRDAPRVADVFLRSPLKASAQQLTFRIVVPRNEVRHLSMKAVVYHAGDRPLRLTGVCRDVTDQFDVENLIAARTSKLHDKVDDLNDYASIVAHDLKEPLRGIAHYAHFVVEDGGKALPADARKGLERITALALRMNDLINAMLTAARIDHENPSLEQTDLDAVLHEVLDSLEGFLKDPPVEVRIPRPLPAIVCNPLRMAEVLRNLITNAAKYNDKPDRWIEVGWLEQELAPTGAQSDQGVTFYVRDNGIGISDAAKEKIFAMFKRLHPRDAFGGGTGAGLAIVKKLIESQGGRIWVASVPGEGTTFFFTVEAINAHNGSTHHPQLAPLPM